MTGSPAAFIAKRLLAAIPVLFGVAVAVFLMTRLLPGDPATFFANTPGATKEDIEEVRRRLGLDRPLHEQFGIYIVDLAQGDLGRSLVTGQDVTADLLARLPASLELTLVAFVLAAAVALPLGIVAATRPGSIVDHVCRILSTAGLSTPVFVTGLLLIYLFYYLLGWAPSPMGRIDMFVILPPRLTGLLLVDSALTGNGEAFRSAFAQIILPASAMAIFALGPLARMTRGAMLGVLASDFIRTARAMGLPRRKILITYAFRNAMLPVVTVLGMVFSYMLGANVLVEKVFAWPGIGRYALDALVSLDYAPVQGFVLVMAFLFVALNCVIDILYAFIDPRVRFEA